MSPAIRVELVLKDKKTGKMLPSPEGKLETHVSLPNDEPVEAELQFKPR